MTTDRKPEYLVSLVHELCKLPQETEWVEFKENKADPQDIGEYLSALANSAALEAKLIRSYDASASCKFMQYVPF